MSSLLCPLCKRSVSQEIASQGLSRLCAECRSMIATIMPQNRPAQTSDRSALATAPSFTAAVVTIPTHTPVSAPAPVQSVPERFAAETRSARHPEPLRMPQEGNFATAETPSFPVLEQVSERSPQSEMTVGNLALASSPEPQPALEAQAEASAVEEDSPYNAAKTAKHVQSPVMDDVPPSWDTTQDQYHPRLLPEERSKTHSSRQTAILALLVIIGLAGGFFLFKAFFKPKTETAKNEPQTQVQAQAPQSSVSALATVEKPSAPTPTPAPQKNEIKPESAPVNNAATAEKPAAKMPDAASIEGQGNLSLQAMLLSTPTAANDFVEKLKKAGIPAYVSPSGSKFKILIGRFTTDADARRYMATARERAKTAGLDLRDLFVNKD